MGKGESGPEQRAEGREAAPDALDGAKKESVAERKNLKQELDLPVFTDVEKVRFEKALGKELNKDTLSVLTLSELQDADVKDPGLMKMMLAKESKFHALNNQELEWKIGLRDLVDQNVAEITLKIHPKNLEKGGNKDLIEKLPGAKEALDAYKKNGAITYIERKSSSRNERGDFSNDDGYFRIFSGDTWTVDKILTEQEMQEKLQELPQTEGNSTVTEGVKASSLKDAVDKFDSDIESEMKHYSVPAELKGFIYALTYNESRWSTRAKNKKSTARGLGQLLRGTALAMHKHLVKEGREGVPQDENEFLEQMKTNQKIQIMALVRNLKGAAKSLRRADPDLDPFANPCERNLAFLAISQHDGQRGVHAYIKWWKDNGRPDELPPFPDKETAERYMLAGFQKRRPLDGAEGTNSLMVHSRKLAANANKFQQQIASLKSSSTSGGPSAA